MNRMDQKIRKAFENATPNVLGSVLSDCQPRKGDATKMKNKTNRKPWIGIASTAAALVLLVGVCAAAAGIIGSGFTLSAGGATGQTDYTWITHLPLDTETLIEIALVQTGFTREQVSDLEAEINNNTCKVRFRVSEYTYTCCMEANSGVFISLEKVGDFFPGASSPEGLRQQYLAFRHALETDTELSENNFVIGSYALYSQIAEGEQKYAHEYAQLLRESSGDVYSFPDEDAFRVAADFARLFRYVMDEDADFGLQKMSASSAAGGTFTLCFDYIALTGYSVKPLPAGSFDSRLGNYCVAITFHAQDMSPWSYKWSQEYPSGEIHEMTLPMGKLRMKWTDTEHDGFLNMVVFIGSDELLECAELTEAKLSGPIGTVSVTLSYPVPDGKISESLARMFALEHAGLKEEQITDYSCQFDTETGGRYHYDIQFTAGGYRYEYEVHAYSTEILKSEKTPVG